MSETVIEVKNIYKVFKNNENNIEALRGIDLEINKSDTLGIVGVSGSGKSTLLHIIGTIERPTKGDLLYSIATNNEPATKKINLFQLSDNELSTFRNENVGFVFQFHYLLPEFSALENVMMPCLIKRMKKKEALDLSFEILNKVGLKNRVNHRPGELSGGEQQRVAIARAMILKPSILLADEPTGDLDIDTGMSIIDLFIRLNEEEGITSVIVTHNRDVANKLKRKVKLEDGQIVNQYV